MKFPWQRIYGYGFAVLVSLMVLVVKYLLGLTFEAPYLLLFVAVVISALYGGLGPSLLATFLTAALVNIYFIFPTGELIVDRKVDIQLVTYIAQGLLVSLIVEWHRRSDRKNRLAEKQLSYLGAIVESAEEAIFSKDLNGIVTSWNKGAEHLYGFKAMEIVGKCIKVTVPEEKIAEWEAMMACLRRGQRTDTLETIRRKKNGDLINVSLTVSLIKNSQGKTLGISSIARNITRRVELEKRRDEFLGLASHELKTPITTIKAYNQALQNFPEVRNSQAALILKKAEGQIDRLTRLITELLNVSRIEEGKLELVPSKFDFDNLVRTTVEDIQVTTAQHKIVLSGRTGETLLADRERIQEVLVNLLTNAIKYSPYGKNVRVNLSAADHHVQVNIRDYGIGISQGDQKKVFEKYYRAQSNNNPYPGLGIGLYLARDIINRHGGKIGVKSRKGLGSNFYFSLPI